MPLLGLKPETFQSQVYCSTTEPPLLTVENRKPLAFIVYPDGSVTKDQSGWGFTVRHGVTTIHEVSFNHQLDNGSGSSQPCWIASRGDSRTTRAIILTDSMSLLQKS